MGEADAITTGMMILFVCAGLLILGVSVPLVLRRIKPNRWYGFRTSETLADEEVWYAANAYSGRLSVGLGALLAVASVALRFVSGIGTSLAVYCTVCGVMFTVGLLAVQVLSVRFVSER